MRTETAPKYEQSAVFPEAGLVPQLGAAVHDCEYAGHYTFEIEYELALRPASYTFHVPQARTDERVGTFELEGVPESCPSDIRVNPTESPAAEPPTYLDDIVFDFNENKLHEALRPFVEDTV